MDRLELLSCDMLSDQECYYKAIKEVRPDYVIHTAAPFIDDVDFRDETKTAEVNERTNSYKNAT